MSTQTITHRQRIDELKSEIAELERACAKRQDDGDFEEVDELDWRIMNLFAELEEVETEWREKGDVPVADSAVLG